MKKEIKFSVLSILFSIIGIIFIVFYNWEISIYSLHMSNKSTLEPNIITTSINTKLLPFSIGVLSLSLVLLDFYKRRTILGVIGIFLSILLMIFSFVPIWPIFI